MLTHEQQSAINSNAMHVQAEVNTVEIVQTSDLEWLGSGLLYTNCWCLLLCRLRTCHSQSKPDQGRTTSIELTFCNKYIIQKVPIYQYCISMYFISSYPLFFCNLECWAKAKSMAPQKPTHFTWSLASVLPEHSQQITFGNGKWQWIIIYDGTWLNNKFKMHGPCK